MAKFRKRPVVIEAWTVDELNHAAAHEWNALPESVRAAYDAGGWVFGAQLRSRVFCALGKQRGICVPTLEGSLFASAGDFIIRGIKGEFYPIKDSIFRETYDMVDD